MSLSVCRLLWLVVGVVDLTVPGSVQAQPNAIDRSIPNDAFGIGEHFEFTVGYGLITAGRATMEVRDVVSLHGRPVYRIVSTATSNRVFDSFYKVRDTMITYMDVDGLFSWRYEKHQREGDYERDHVVVFDQVNGLAVVSGDTIFVPAYIQDVLAAFYFVRAQSLGIGDTLYLPNLSEKTSYELRVVVHDRERIRTPAGEFDCVQIEPMLAEEGLFRHEGRVTIWLTDDRVHMPVRVESRVVVGSIHAELTAFRLGQLWEE